MYVNPFQENILLFQQFCYVCVRSGEVNCMYMLSQTKYFAVDAKSIKN